ncbi:MAG: plastocyanin/azurin family copper-binding protein [Longimicrobiales bacterium]
MIRRATVFLLMPTFVAATLAGCFSDEPDDITDPTPDFVSCSASAPSPPADARVIRIQNFAFGPAQLTIPSGTTVYWINCDNDQHTTTSDNGVWDSPLLSENSAFSRRFDATGSFPYHCTPHPFMTASITVQ